MPADHLSSPHARPSLREVLAVLALLGSVAGVGMAFAWPWLPGADAGSAALASFAPVSDGRSVLFAKRGADGALTSWESQNHQILRPGRALAAELRKAQREALGKLFLRAGESRLDDDVLLRRLGRATLVRTVARELSARGGAVGSTVGLTVRDRRGEHLLALYDPAHDRDMVFDPAVPTLPGDLSPGRAWEATGKLAGSIDYAFSGRVLEAGPFRGEAGSFADCRRIETRLALASEGATLSDETWRGWHCAGVGMVEEATHDAGGKRTGMRVAVAADGIRTSAALVPPAAPVAAGPAPAAPAGGEWHLTRVARIGHTVNASESTIPPVWIPGEPAALLVAGQGSDLTAYDASDPTGKVLWRFHPGGTVYSPPAHDPGTGRIYFGASDKRLYALDSRGIFLWSFRTGDNVATRPAVAGGVVVFGSEDRTVYAVDAATGALRWKRTTGGPVVSSPVVVGSTVVIGSDDGAVYALDLRTGAERWTAETGDAVEAPVVATDGAVYVAGRDKTLRALDPRTGETRWKAQVGNVVRAAAAAGPAGVYVVDHYGYLKAFEPRSGRRLWTSPTDGYTGPAAMVNGELFVARSDGGVHRVDARSGRRAAEWKAVTGVDGRAAGFYLGAAPGGGAVWLADFGANVWRLGPGTGGARPLPLAWSRTVSERPFELNLLTTTPVRWGARTLLLDRSNHLYELDAATGNAVRLGKVEDDRSAMVEPTVSGGTLLVPAGNTLFAARLPDGGSVWSFRGEGTALAPAVAAGGTVLWTAQRDGGSEGNESGTLYAVDLATGRLRWSFPIRGVGTVGGAVVRGGTVFLGTPATALDLATGRVLWTARSAEVPLGAPTLAEGGDVVYAAALSRDGTQGSVSALGASDGRVRWRRALGRDEVLNFLERIWTAGDRVIVPSLSGRVIALDAATGEERWRYAPDAPRLGGITVDGEATYLALQNGQVVVLDTRTGRPTARFSDLELDLSGFSYAERPVRVGDRLVVATGTALLGFDVSPR